jgi:hypothetical protein
MVLAVPTLMGFFSTLTLLFAPALILLLALSFGLLLPALDYAVRATGWRLIGGAAVCGAVAYLAALAANGPSPDRPEWSCLAYGLDVDSGRAHWISNDPAPDIWNAACFPSAPLRETIQEYIPWETETHLKGPAPVVDVQGPEIELLRDEERDGVRVVAVKAFSPRGAPTMTLYSKNKVLSASILGVEVAGADSDWYRTIHALPLDGADVVFRIPAGQTLHLKAVERSYGLPQLESPGPRPAHFIGEPNTTLDHARPLRSDHVFVARSFAFPPAAGVAETE